MGDSRVLAQVPGQGDQRPVCAHPRRTLSADRMVAARMRRDDCVTHPAGRQPQCGAATSCTASISFQPAPILVSSTRRTRCTGVAVRGKLATSVPIWFGA